jgi:hypothetical protein
MATDIAVALSAQMAVGVLLYWSLSASWTRKIAWLGSIPLAMALNIAYLGIIPAFFLIEADTASEINTWTEHCFVQSVVLRPVRSTVQTAHGVRTWWAARAPDGRDTLLRVPECETTDAVLPAPGKSPEGYPDFSLGLLFASPDGAAIVQQMDGRTSRRTWWTLAHPAASLHRLTEASETFESAPILSRSGNAVAYVTTIPESGPPVLSRVRVRKAFPESTAVEADIDLAPFGPALYAALDVDAEAREVLLWRDDRPLLVSFDGQSRPVRFQPKDIDAQSTTYLRAGD